MSLTSAWAQARRPISISADGWTVTADPGRSILTVSQNKLGTVLEDVRLDLKIEVDLHPLENWAVQKSSQHELSIGTAEPQTARAVEKPVGDHWAPPTPLATAMRWRDELYWPSGKLDDDVNDARWGPYKYKRDGLCVFCGSYVSIRRSRFDQPHSTFIDSRCFWIAVRYTLQIQLRARV